jgi:hypothetical protein
MTEKINRKAKKDMPPKCLMRLNGAFKFQLCPGRDKPKKTKTINEKLDFVIE